MIILGNKYILNNLEKTKLKTKHILIEIQYTKTIKEEAFRNLKEYIPLDIDKIIIVNTDIELSENIQNLINKHNIKTVTIEQFLEQKLKKLYLSKDNIVKIKPFTKWQYLQKRTIDLIVSIPLFIISFPIMLYSAYKIKKESPDAGIFFMQKRVGKNEKLFNCYKFRSMRTDVKYFNKYTQEDDPRVFPWGNFMRKSRIDELPQLWNVIKGDMHLIGPRAEWVDLVKDYEKKLPNYHTRHIIAPGITGWAQVNYPYGANLEDTRQKLMYDLYYIKHWNIWLEIKTIFKTIMVVAGKMGR